jgi:hypothetical protein
MAQTNWNEILKEIRTKYNKARQNESCHNSHTASRVMREVAESHGVGYGIEGFCDDVGRHGISYINMGDTYDTTIIFRSESERFSIGDWGSIVERYPSRYR